MDKPDDKNLIYFEKVRIVWQKHGCVRHGIIEYVGRGSGDPHVLFDGAIAPVKSQWEYIEVS